MSRGRECAGNAGAGGLCSSVALAVGGELSAASAAAAVTLALMTRKVPGIGRNLMYGCRGPVCDLDDRETFAQLLDGAKALAKKYKAYVIKIDPDVPPPIQPSPKCFRASASAARRAARISRPSSRAMCSA